MQKIPLSVGSDPEFVFGNHRGTPVSAIPIVKYSKDNRLKFDDNTALYHDNVAVEGNIPPASNKEELKGNLLKLFRNCKRNFDQNVLIARAAHNYPKKQLRSRIAREFGCSPERDCYTGEQCYPYFDGSSLRVCGGHIHIGNPELETNKNAYLGDEFTKGEMIRLMDIFVGIPMVIMDNDPTSAARKRLYGNAGRYRETPYGVEYRTLSNYWLTTPELADLTYELTELAFETGISGRAGEYILRFNENEIIHCINTNDKEIAKVLIERIQLSNELLDKVNFLSSQKFSEDVYKNWGI